jgi:acyl-[acyl carrier protein]--UDP-N-acetylglucosamine O-acyltransferase
MIHQLAAVDKRAKISKNVIVEPFTTIAGDVEIGEGTWIGPMLPLWMVQELVKIVEFFREL